MINLKHNSILVNSHSFVNDILSEEEGFFDLFVQEEIKADRKIEESKKSFSSFFNLIPNIHQFYVNDIIKTQYHGDIAGYIASVPLFIELFTAEHRDICNGSITYATKSHKDPKTLTQGTKDRLSHGMAMQKQQTKDRKELLLWSAQLLGLMGGKGKYSRAEIIPTQLTEHYKNEMIKADEYIQSLGLINADGKFTRLPTNENKQRQKLARIKKRTRFADEACKDRGFTWSFITLTLPPSYHPNPIKGKNSYSGVKPVQSYNHLQNYWKLIRANIAKAGLRAGMNEDYFGFLSSEAQKDSTMHMHIVMFHSFENTKLIHNIVKKVQYSSDETVKFDIKLNNGKAKASSYIFKYIMKTNAIYTEADDSSMRTTACRYFYSARGFNFFGDNHITMFDFLYSNHKHYMQYFSDEMIKMFAEMDYFTFSKTFSKYFKNEYRKDCLGNKQFIGVSYSLPVFIDKEIDGQRNISQTTGTILIEKRQYCIFEKYEGFDDKTQSILELDMTLPVNTGIQSAFESATWKQKLYDEWKANFFNDNGLMNLAETLPDDFEPHLINGVLSFNPSYEDTHYYIDINHDFITPDSLRIMLINCKVTVNQHYSRKSEEKPKPNP